MSQLDDLLFLIRQHPAYHDLLNLVAAPRVPRFKKSSVEQPQAAFADWVYQSGCAYQHELWRNALIGKNEPSDKEKS